MDQYQAFLWGRDEFWHSWQSYGMDVHQREHRQLVDMIIAQQKALEALLARIERLEQ